MLKLIKPPQPKRRVTGLSAYRLYLMLKNHFKNGSFDVIKYNWSGMNVSEKAWAKNKQRNVFIRMADKYDLGTLSELMILNFISNPDAWGGEIVNADSMAHHNKMIGYHAAIESHFKSEVLDIFYFCEQKQLKFKDVLFSIDCQTPWIFKLMQRDIISYEIVLLLDSLFKFIDKYDNQKDHIWKSGYEQRLKAYRKLLIIDEAYTKQVFLSVVQRHKELLNAK
ncbi:hypothetical protein VmeM32_00102 [Vibrio phage vB_VmeM-32]|nr:hypothetical protein VmeM32_00102 [Vibrio phage vB_VmeM-32]